MHTEPIPTIVTADITLNLVVGDEHSMPVPACFSYSAHEPLSVTAAFQGNDTSVKWVFARSLLKDGVSGPVGEGDVACWPTTVCGEQVVCISLRSPSGQALLEAPLDEVSSFLQRAFEVVPEGSESDFLDLDGLIQDLLDDPWK
jgi:hypothetical protein